MPVYSEPEAPAWQQEAPQAWMDQAACAGMDPEAFFPHRQDGAATYASTLPGGVVMEVHPLGRLERDPESMLGTSFRCRSARVIRWQRLSKWEREARSRMVAIARRTEE